jgi:hypothetical protein
MRDHVVDEKNPVVKTGLLVPKVDIEPTTCSL